MPVISGHNHIKKRSKALVCQKRERHCPALVGDTRGLNAFGSQSPERFSNARKHPGLPVTGFQALRNVVFNSRVKRCPGKSHLPAGKRLLQQYPDALTHHVGDFFFRKRRLTERCEIGV